MILQKVLFCIFFCWKEEEIGSKNVGINFVGFSYSRINFMNLIEGFPLIFQLCDWACPSVRYLTFQWEAYTLCERPDHRVRGISFVWELLKQVIMNISQIWPLCRKKHLQWHFVGLHALVLVLIFLLFCGLTEVAGLQWQNYSQYWFVLNVKQNPKSP